MARAASGAVVGVLLLPLLWALVACSSRPQARAQSDPATPEAVAVALVPESSPAQDTAAAPLPLAGRRICLDPGHDAYWAPGASARPASGAVPVHPAEGIRLHEHELTLSVAYRLGSLLAGDGAQVCVTRRPRDAGGGLQIEPYDFTGDGRVRTSGYVEDVPELIQPRIDWANSFGAEVLISVHFNGIEDPRMRGTEVYFSEGVARSEEGRRLASAILRGLLEEMRDSGYEAIDRGIRSDAYQRYSPDETRRMLANNASIIRANGADPANCPACYRLLTPGNNPMSLHLGEYVGALVEVEFLSNPAVVESFLLRPDSLDVIARGLLRGVRLYFAAD